MGYVNPTTGKIAENVNISEFSDLGDIVADANGNLWFTNGAGSTGEYVIATSTLTYPTNRPPATPTRFYLTRKAISGSAGISADSGSSIPKQEP